MKMRLLASAFACLLLSACGGSASIPDTCARLADCENQGDTPAECEESLTSQRADAESAGCGGEFDDYLSCVDGASDVCDSNALLEECAEEAFALFACIGFVDDDPQPG